MGSSSSFDVVSKTDPQEVRNAVNQATKELSQRFDFKGSKSSITLEESEITVLSDDEYRLKSVLDILQSKLIKRGVSLKALVYGKVEDALGGSIRQKITIQQGIPQEKAKNISQTVRESRLKVQVQIQGDQIRVSGKNKDDLQSTIALLRGKDFGLPLDFTNYR